MTLKEIFPITIFSVKLLHDCILKFSILFLQALFGWLFFGEVLGLNWFAGTSLAVAGGALLISGEKSAKAKPGKKDD